MHIDQPISELDSSDVFPSEVILLASEWGLSHENLPANLIGKVRATPRVAFFTWEAVWESILFLEKLIKRRKILVNDATHKRVLQNHVSTSFCGVQMHIEFGC